MPRWRNLKNPFKLLPKLQKNERRPSNKVIRPDLRPDILRASTFFILIPLIHIQFHQDPKQQALRNLSVTVTQINPKPNPRPTFHLHRKLQHEHLRNYKNNQKLNLSTRRNPRNNENQKKKLHSSQRPCRKSQKDSFDRRR